MKLNASIPPRRAMLNIENSEALKPSDVHQGYYAVSHLLFHPGPNVSIGGEFQFGRWVNFSDGFNFNNYRSQLWFKYECKRTFEF